MATSQVLLATSPTPFGLVNFLLTWCLKRRTLPPTKPRQRFQLRKGKKRWRDRWETVRMGGYYPTRSTPRRGTFKPQPRGPANDNTPLRKLPQPANDNWSKPATAPTRGWERGIALKWALRLGAGFAIADIFQQWYRWRPAQAGGTDYSGWTEYMNCFPKARGPYGQRKNFGLSCGGNSSVLAWQIDMAQGPNTVTGQPGIHRYFIMYLGDPITQSGDTITGKTASAMYQDVPAGNPYVLPQPLPAIMPVLQPALVPSVHPALDPMSLPIARPVITPRPLPVPLVPYLRPNPWRSPSEQTQRGPSPKPKAQPDYPGHISIEISPSGRVRTRPQAKPKHQNKPPRPKDREKKAKANPAAGSALGKVLGWATEGVEVIDDIYNNLPPYVKAREGLFVKGKKPTPQAKLRAILNNHDKVDWWGAFRDIAANQAEDAVIGRIGRAAGAAAGQTYGPGGLGPQGRPFGFQAGPAH